MDYPFWLELPERRRTTRVVMCGARQYIYQDGLALREIADCDEIFRWVIGTKSVAF
jgi:hypothetical protein